MLSPHDDDAGSGSWPAFTDLFAATSLLFLVLFAAIAVPAIGRAKESRERESTIQSVDSLLRKTVVDPRVHISRVGDYLLVRITEEATFPQRQYSIDQLKPVGKQILEQVGVLMRQDTIRQKIDQLQVVGHASAEGADSVNWRLSSLRAATVAQFLIDSIHLSPCFISALGRSRYYPVSPEAARRRDALPAAADRRIELEIRPVIPRDTNQALRRTQCVAPMTVSLSYVKKP